MPGMEPRGKVARVRVPASTSNIGSGFDTLGLAVNVGTRLTLRLSEGGVELRGEPDRVGDSARALVVEAAALFYEAIGRAASGMRVEIGGDAPIGRGLGASAGLRVGVLAGLNALHGGVLDRAEIAELGTRLEGHPDNVTPSLHGGFTVAGRNGLGRLKVFQFPVRQSVRLPTWIPDFEVGTAEARRLLPGEYSRADSAHALNRAACVVAAVASDRLEDLAGLMDDRFHQPHRAGLVPGMNEVIQAGVSAGAVAGWLSGSGSSVMCLALDGAEAVAAAMRGVARGGKVVVLEPDMNGARVEVGDWGD